MSLCRVSGVVKDGGRGLDGVQGVGLGLQDRVTAALDLGGAGGETGEEGIVSGALIASAGENPIG